MNGITWIFFLVILGVLYYSTMAFTLQHHNIIK